MEEISQAAAALTALEQSVLTASAQLSSVAALQGSTAKRRRGLDVITELEQLRRLTQPLLDEHDGRFEIESTRGAVHRTEMRPELFAAVMSAMIATAIEWRHRTRQLTIPV